MSLTNPFGDVEITDPTAMRALAHPVRLAILARLQRHGPATATRLSEHVGASPSVVSWHLRHLAEFGLVEDAEDPEGDRRRRWWKSVRRGFRFGLPEAGEGQAASRMLRGRLLDQALGEVRQWATESEPDLDEPWHQVVGIYNTGIRLSLEEARRIEDGIEELLAPYVTRADDAVPADARRVRMVRITMPEPPESSTEPDR